MGNSQPVSNVETYRAGRCQSTEWLYLVVNNLLPHPLSAYRKEHSTVMLIASCLVRLIVSRWSAARYAAGTVGPLGRFQLCLSRHSPAASVGLFSVWTDRRRPQWTESFLSYHTQQIAFNVNYLRHNCLELRKGPCWVHSCMFCLYTAELAKAVARHGLKMHQNADDIQIYAYTTVDDARSAVDRFAMCLTDVEAWLRATPVCLDWTQTKLRLSGWVQGNSSPSLTSPKCMFSRHA